jgi:tRNA-2-methylthio-N6-dimethylallyladenosine synthase
MEGHLTWEEKRDRLIELNSLQYQIALEENRKLEGETFEVLVEGASKTSDKLSGRTRTNRIIIFPGPLEWSGSLVHVKISKGKTFSLFGEVPDGTANNFGGAK